MLVVGDSDGEMSVKDGPNFIRKVDILNPLPSLLLDNEVQDTRTQMWFVSGRALRII
jgi:hypothetical protein